MDNIEQTIENDYNNNSSFFKNVVTVNSGKYMPRIKEKNIG